MKIAIVTPYAYPEYGACSNRAKSFADYFISKGYEVKVFAPSRGRIEAAGKFSVRYKSVRNLLNMMSKGNFDVVIASSPPIIHPFFVIVACKMKGIPCILDIRDPFTHVVRNLGLKKVYSVHYMLYKIIEYLSHRLADSITAVTQFDVDLIRKNYGREAYLIANGTDFNPRPFSKRKRMTVRRKMLIPTGKRVIVFAGGPAKGKELDIFLRACAPTIKKYDAHLAMSLVSDMSPQSIKAEKDIKNITLDLGIQKNACFMKNLSSEDLINLLLCSDIAIDPLENSFIYCIPVKTYDYMACYLPIAAKGPEGGELHKFIERHKAGFFAENWEQFSIKLENALKHIDAFREIGINNSRIASKNFSREKSSRKMLKLIESMV